MRHHPSAKRTLAGRLLLVERELEQGCPDTRMGRRHIERLRRRASGRRERSPASVK